MNRRFSVVNLWLAVALCWPVGWLVFMDLAPGSVAPPPPPSAAVTKHSNQNPAIDRSGSLGSSADNSAKVFWDIPEPGRIRLTIELDTEKFQDPLAVYPDDSQ